MPEMALNGGNYGAQLPAIGAAKAGAAFFALLDKSGGLTAVEKPKQLAT